MLDDTTLAYLEKNKDEANPSYWIPKLIAEIRRLRTLESDLAECSAMAHRNVREMQTTPLGIKIAWPTPGLFPRGENKPRYRCNCGRSWEEHGASDSMGWFACPA